MTFTIMEVYSEAFRKDTRSNSSDWELCKRHGKTLGLSDGFTTRCSVSIIMDMPAGCRRVAGTRLSSVAPERGGAGAAQSV